MHTLLLDRAEGASMDDLCRMIEAMTAAEKYFTPEQRARELRAEWAALIPAVRAKMDGGDAGISKAMMTMYQHEGRALCQQMGDAIPAPEMFAYAGKANAVRKGLPEAPLS